jgi:nucleoside-diphosphate-sugar epimerase
MSEIILVIGASGQIGQELTQKLRMIYGNNHVIASDIREGENDIVLSGPFEIVNATDKATLLKIIKKYKVTQVYLLAAMLSATAEKQPIQAWNLNINSLLAVLNLAKEKHIKKVYWPSSIAVFGPTAPKKNTPQNTIMKPTTIYGISKVAGEFWCNYYYEKFGVDVRSLRYPGIISWKSKPGGGTTDYAVDIYFDALQKKSYQCFLSKNTRLPMMYMEDAVEATIQLMQTNTKNVTIRTGYNLAAMSFTPEEIALEIKQYIPEFKISYRPDSRQQIANSWPESIDNSKARKDWNWQHTYNLSSMTSEIIKNLKKNPKFC